jgi:two-component system, chemotaxis family, protein-glutamate methylesterase/glutaminase
VQTGIAWPGCSGTLIVFLRRRFAAFRCRIGNAYSLPEVLAAKEDILERRLWEAVSSLEELADFLETASRERFAHVDPDSYRRRGTAARDHAAVQRSVINSERPLRSDAAAADAPGT